MLRQGDEDLVYVTQISSSRSPNTKKGSRFFARGFFRKKTNKKNTNRGGNTAPCSSPIVARVAKVVPIALSAIRAEQENRVVIQKMS